MTREEWKAKWLKLPHWERGLYLGLLLVVVLILTFLVYAAVIQNQICSRYQAFTDCLPWWDFLGQMLGLVYVHLFLWVVLPIIGLSIGLQILFSKLFKR